MADQEDSRLAPQNNHLVILDARFFMTFLVAQTVKRLSAMWETRVQSLGWEDLLGREMATHPIFLAWNIPWAEEPGRGPWGRKSWT